MTSGRFRELDKVAEQRRVMGMCSNPACREPTFGPGAGEAVWIAGDAAHIRGRRTNRYDPNMSDAQRASASNLIWLCANCHRKSDAGEISDDQLEIWRAQARNYSRALGGVDGAAPARVTDCPWCKRPVLATASRCAHCRDVFRDPLDLLHCSYLALTCALGFPMLSILWRASLLTTGSVMVCTLIAGLAAGTLVLRHREGIARVERQMGDRFVRINHEPEGDRWVANREYRFATPRVISRLELARLGYGVEVV